MSTSDLLQVGTGLNFGVDRQSCMFTCPAHKRAWKESDETETVLVNPAFRVHLILISSYPQCS